MTLKNLSVFFTSHFLIGAALIGQSASPSPALAAGWSRQVGPEPGLEFASTLPAGVSQSQYGDEERPITSTYSNAADPTMLMAVDVNVTDWASDLPTLIPQSVAQQFFVPVTYQGTTSNAVISYCTPSNPIYGFNVASSAYLNYIFNYWVPNLLLPHSPNARFGIPTNPSHPTYVALDGLSTNYDFYGVFAGQGLVTYPNVTWAAGYPQNSSQWEAAWVAFFAYAKQNAPSVRLSAHVFTLDDYSTFQTIFANCPAMDKEHFPLSSLASLSSYQHGTLYNQIMSLYWFANVAPPVFSTAVNPNEPQTRVLQVGVDIDNGDIQTALAFYTMYRGPNTFFDALTGGGTTAVNPSTWLPQANQLGAGTSAPTVLTTAGGQTAASGYVVLQRTWQHGVTYMNLSGSTQTITVPSGATNWEGQSITSITLGNGQGAVVFF